MRSLMVKMNYLAADTRIASSLRGVKVRFIDPRVPPLEARPLRQGVRRAERGTRGALTGRSGKRKQGFPALVQLLVESGEHQAR